MTTREIVDVDGKTVVATEVREGDVAVFVTEGEYVAVAPEVMTTEQLRRLHTLIGQVLERS